MDPYYHPEKFKMWLYFIIPYGLFSLYRWVRDKNRTFQDYLEPELKQHGFEFILSRTHPNTIFKDPENDTWFNMIGGGWATVVSHMSYQTRKIKFKDTLGHELEAFASIDIKKGVLMQRVVRVRWKPDLKTFQLEENHNK